jgi:hypothetical protein
VFIQRLLSCQSFSEQRQLFIRTHNETLFHHRDARQQPDGLASLPSLANEWIGMNGLEIKRHG